MNKPHTFPIGVSPLAKEEVARRNQVAAVDIRTNKLAKEILCRDEECLSPTQHQALLRVQLLNDGKLKRRQAAFASSGDIHSNTANALIKRRYLDRHPPARPGGFIRYTITRYGREWLDEYNT